MTLGFSINIKITTSELIEPMFISDYRKEIVTTNILALSSFLSVQKASSTFNYAPPRDKVRA